MKTLWQKISSLPIILGGLAIFILMIIVSPNLALPDPFRFFKQWGGQLGLGGEGRSGVSEEFVGPKVDISSEVQPVPSLISPPYIEDDDFTSFERYIVRSANLNLEVDAVSQAVEESSQYVNSIGGLVSSSSVTKTEDGYIGYLTVRVPEAEFSSALQFFKGLAKLVKEEQINSYDETGQVASAEENLENLKTQVGEYRRLLQEAQNTNEKIRLQQQIDQLDRQIRNLERQLGNLENKAVMSRITITFTEEKFKLPFLDKLGLSSSIREATRALKRVVVSLLILGVWVIIFTPIWLPVVLVTKWLKKKK